MQFPQSVLSLCLACLIVLCSLKSVSLNPIDCTRHCVCMQLSMTCVGLNLTSVPDNVSAEINVLNLTANNIESITDADFWALEELENVDVSYNALANISLGAFDRNRKLRVLSLTHNVLDVEAVLAAGRSPVQKLLLTANRIRDLDQFFESSSLSFLDLSENSVHSVPAKFLKNLPNLEHLSLAGNRIERFVLDKSFGENRLKHLNLSRNSITQFSVSTLFGRLEVLDLSWNFISAIDPEWFASFPNLTVFVFTGNRIDSIPDFAFRHSWHLQAITLNSLHNLTAISKNTFYRLEFLERLQLSENSRLTAVDVDALSSLQQLKHLDLSRNNLSSFHLNLLINLMKLEFVDLTGNAWTCDCLTLNQFLVLQDTLAETGCILKLDPICGVLLSPQSRLALNLTSALDCRVPKILSTTKTVSHAIGSSARLDCVAVSHPMPQVIWTTNRNVTVKNSTLGRDMSLMEDIVKQAPGVYVKEMEDESRMFVLPNGSLYVTYVTRKDGGVYTCFSVNEYGNATMLVEFQLNYEVMSYVVITSIVLGFLTAVGFFLIAVIVGIARYLTLVCSRKEQKKRKSIREVLDTIHDYKAAQFDRFSAYRTAKMDQLSAFKSAKIDQLSAFRHSRVGRLRTYKQATVTSVLHYLERMREHYTNQTARIKDNCAQQMDKLRDTYGVQRGKFKDYRSHQVERMRENYNAQVLKVREYGVQQMSRLREQYKSQQQNVLKLLELLDVGNCVTVIEAECMHTESVIFDASIAFDFEAHPIHVPRDTDSSLSDESHYLTASESSSNSNENIPLSCSADIEPRVERAGGSGRNSPSELIYRGVISHGDIALSSMGDSSGGTGVAELERETEC